MERERRSPYKEFQPGDTLSFHLQTLLPDGTVRVEPKTVVIEDVKSGGFFGNVLILKDKPLVIKTPDPEPTHRLLRAKNWSTEFPHYSSQTEAAQEHVAMRIIHNTVRYASESRFYAPYSFGFVQLPNGHYGQVIERVDGRPPRFDVKEDEYRMFREAQKELTELAFKLGFEHVGQIHPDNPFGMPNIWYDGKNKRFVWLDTLPAIPHKGRLWPVPFYKFSFHEDIRKRLNSQGVTFNRIHTEILSKALWEMSSKFPPKILEEIRKDIELYERLTEQKNQEIPKSNSKEVREAFIEFSKSLFTERFIYKFLTGPKFRKQKIEALVALLKDPEYRRLFINDMILSGVKNAKKNNLITEDEYSKALEAVEKSERDPEKEKALIGLQVYYFITNRMVDLVSTSAALSTLLANSPEALAALEFFIIQVVFPPLVRLGGTEVVSKVRKQDLRIAKRITALPLIPFLPSYGAIPAQIAVSSTSKSDLLWHHTVRKLTAVGGYGSQLEAELWKRIGRRLEELGVKNGK